MSGQHDEFIAGMKKGLAEAQEKNETFRHRARYVVGQLEEAGYPLVADKLLSGLVLLSGPGYGDRVLDEVEGLVEVLTVAPGDRPD